MDDRHPINTPLLHDSNCCLQLSQPLVLFADAKIF